MQHSTILREPRPEGIRTVTKARIEKEIENTNRNIEQLLERERQLQSLAGLTRQILESMATLSESFVALESEYLPRKGEEAQEVRTCVRFILNRFGVVRPTHFSEFTPRICAAFLFAEYRKEILAAIAAEFFDDHVKTLQGLVSDRADDLKDVGMFVAVTSALDAHKRLRASI